MERSGLKKSRAWPSSQSSCAAKLGLQTSGLLTPSRVLFLLEPLLKLQFIRGEMVMYFFFNFMHFFIFSFKQRTYIEDSPFPGTALRCGNNKLNNAWTCPWQAHGLGYPCSVLSCWVLLDTLQSHGLWPTRLLCPWGFSRQEYWSGLPCPPPGDLPNPGIESRFPSLQEDPLPTVPLGKP